MSRKWDKMHRDSRAQKPLSNSQFRSLRLRRLLDWSRKHPESRGWKLPQV